MILMDSIAEWSPRSMLSNCDGYHPVVELALVPFCVGFFAVGVQLDFLGSDEFSHDFDVGV